MGRLKKLKKIRIHREGTHILWGSFFLLLIINLALYWGIDCKIPFYLVALVSIVVYLLMVNFFRCPIRLFGQDTEKIVVAPADGKIVVIEEVDEHEYFHDRRIMVSIFMSILNVHANWYPVDGVVKKVTHDNGKFMKAWLPKASTENERSMIVIETPEGVEVMARQIAGAMARRIVTYAEPGEECYIDEHLGFIKFGSRVDVYLPLGTEICVSMGQLTTGNQTVIAKLKKETIMANAITRHIPNTVTCLNLFSGCIAGVMAFEAKYELAFIFIILSAVFDFFDGMLARLLHAYSPIGKELDSLADDVSFGVAPSLLVFSFLKEPGLIYPDFLAGLRDYIPYLAFLISIFSALRLANFNVDERQTSSFIGLPVPANALYWGALIVGGKNFLLAHCNVIYLIIMVMLFSWLLVAEIPMFSLKFKNLSWKDNKVSFIFLIVCIPLLLFLGISGFSAVIVWYIILSLLTRKNK